MKRRDLLKAIPAAGVAIAIPTVPAMPTLAAAEAESASVRLAIAIQNLKEVMEEVYGVAPTDKSQLTLKSGVVVISAMPHPMDQVKWWVDDGSPLLPNEKAWAEWEAERARLDPSRGRKVS